MKENTNINKRNTLNDNSYPIRELSFLEFLYLSYSSVLFNCTKKVFFEFIDGQYLYSMVSD
jgi:hypothetical protein